MEDKSFRIRVVSAEPVDYHDMINELNKMLASYFAAGNVCFEIIEANTNVYGPNPFVPRSPIRPDFPTVPCGPIVTLNASEKQNESSRPIPVNCGVKND